jgi:hypothetical protein
MVARRPLGHASVAAPPREILTQRPLASKAAKVLADLFGEQSAA